MTKKTTARLNWKNKHSSVATNGFENEDQRKMHEDLPETKLCYEGIKGEAGAEAGRHGRSRRLSHSPHLVSQRRCLKGNVAFSLVCPPVPGGAVSLWVSEYETSYFPHLMYLRPWPENRKCLFNPGNLVYFAKDDLSIVSKTETLSRRNLPTYMALSSNQYRIFAL